MMFGDGSYEDIMLRIYGLCVAQTPDPGSAARAAVEVYRILFGNVKPQEKKELG